MSVVQEACPTPVDENRWLKCYIRSIIDQVMDVEKFCEAIVLSLFLLWMLPDMSRGFLLSGKRMSVTSSSEQPDDRECSICVHTRRLTVDNLEEAFKGNSELYETTAALSLREISVRKSLLSAPFSSSKVPVQSVMQVQYLPVDYHAYVVFNTRDGMWWSLDKTAEGIFVSWGGSYYSVTECFDGHLRPTSTIGHSELISDESDRTVSDLVSRLKYILKSNKYDLIQKNCQHFAKEIFDKFAINKTWELFTVSDLTSPLMQLSRLLSSGGFPQAKLLYIVFLFSELYLLYGENREKESHHHLFVMYTVIIVTGIVLLIDYLLILPFFQLERLLVIKYLGTFFVLYLEAKHYSLLGTIRKRAHQYRKMSQSATWFKKYFSLPLGYTMVYVGPVCMKICEVLIVAVGVLYYIIYKYIKSDLYPSLSELEKFYCYCSEISIFTPIILLYIPTVLFLYWKNYP